MKSTVFKAAVGASAFLISLTTWAQQDEPRPQDTPRQQRDEQTDSPKMDLQTGEPRGQMGEAEKQKKLGKVDRDFAINAASSGLAEVELGKLAQEQGQSQEVKDFGEMLVSHHEKANRDLEAAVIGYSVTLPTALDAEHQRDYDKLKAMKGSQFDNAFAKHMVKDHEREIKRFKKQAKSGQAEELKEFAARTVPVLESHLKMARELTKGKPTTSSL